MPVLDAGSSNPAPVGFGQLPGGRDTPESLLTEDGEDLTTEDDDILILG